MARQFVSRSIVAADLIQGYAPGRVLYVSAGTGATDTNDGLDASTPKNTLAGALAVAVSGDTILVLPGSYPSTGATVPVGLNQLTILGVGPQGSAIFTAATNGTTLTVHGDDVTIQNVSLVGNGTGGSLIVSGSRFRAVKCLFKTGALGVNIIPGTTAQQGSTPPTRGAAVDGIYDTCEFAGPTTCVALTGTSGGAADLQRFRNCQFHSFATAALTEVVGSGGAAAATHSRLEVTGCYFGRKTDGTEPTNYILLNGNNANFGVIQNCQFPTALAGGKNLVSTLDLFVGNFMTGGLSNAQPS